jgi:hypothetical protein
LPGLKTRSRTMILPISTSQVAGITGMSHCICLKSSFFLYAFH